MEKRTKNVILEPVPPDAGIIGGPSSDLPVLVEDGNWEPYLPDFEAQSRLNLETMNCVQFSFLNVLETQARLLGRSLNLSDRFLSWAAGNTPRGNTYTACLYGFRNRGCCSEERWPWLVQMGFDEYNREPPDDVKAEALRLLDEWDVGMLHYVPSNLDSIREALRLGPIWFCNDYHSMELYALDDRIRAFDTYNGGKRSFDLSYVDRIEAAYLVPFTPKKQENDNNMLALLPNCLVVVTDGHGEMYGSVDGSRLYFDDYGKILAMLDARNSKPCPESTCEHCQPGKYVYHTRRGDIPFLHVKSADVAGMKVVNLKNIPV